MEGEFDSTVSRKPVPRYSTEATTPKKFKVAYIRETHESEGLQPEIKKSITTAVEKIKAAGHVVEVIDFPYMLESREGPRRTRSGGPSA